MRRKGKERKGKGRKDANLHKYRTRLTDAACITNVQGTGTTPDAAAAPPLWMASWVRACSEARRIPWTASWRPPTWATEMARMVRKSCSMAVAASSPSTVTVSPPVVPGLGLPYRGRQGEVGETESESESESEVESASELESWYVPPAAAAPEAGVDMDRSRNRRLRSWLLLESCEVRLGIALRRLWAVLDRVCGPCLVGWVFWFLFLLLDMFSSVCFFLDARDIVRLWMSRFAFKKESSI